MQELTIKKVTNLYFKECGTARNHVEVTTMDEDKRLIVSVSEWDYVTKLHRITAFGLMKENVSKFTDIITKYSETASKKREDLLSTIRAAEKILEAEEDISEEDEAKEIAVTEARRLMQKSTSKVEVENVEHFTVRGTNYTPESYVTLTTHSNAIYLSITSDAYLPVSLRIAFQDVKTFVDVLLEHKELLPDRTEQKVNFKKEQKMVD